MYSISNELLQAGRLICSRAVKLIVSRRVERYSVQPCYITPPTLASLFYAAHCKAGMTIPYATKIVEL